MAATAGQSPFVKQLASSDKDIRDKAVASLRVFLGRAAAFDELELKKLWRGLYYCMWLQDKPINQQALAREFAGMLNVLQPVNFLPFLKAFYQTMSDEWNNIDPLRRDKYMYLVRCNLYTSLEIVSEQKWQKKALDGLVDLLEAIPFETKNPKIPNGLRFHMVDIYVDELDKVDSDNTAPLEKLLEPLQNLSKHAYSKAVRSRAKEALDDDRLEDWANRKADEKGDESEDDEDNEDKAASEGAGDGFTGFGD